jgi:GntR family transcriptional regulator/MocR family aminotransferase
MDFIGVFFDKRDAAPLYHQLYRHLAAQIRDGALAAGERLPGKRSAAVQLGVSVNTVDGAYQMLAAEGYLEARPRSGFVVRRVGQLVPPPRPAAAGKDAGTAPGGRAAKWTYSFASGGLDPGLFPLKTWNRLLREVLAGEAGLFTRGESGGDEVLRQAIVAYLRAYRGVRCTAGQLVVGAGLEVLVGMLGRLLVDAPFAIEDPGYPKTGRILRNMGLRVTPLPVDEGGICPDALARSGAGAVYITPSHQFPGGGVMPVGRRAELLAWAGAGRVIVEDDHDSEFRFDGRPLPCLQGLDGAGRVVYAGTFSRSLAPGLRAAYLVLPPALLRRWQAAYGDYACTVSRPEQHTLARLMAEGHFARSLNRARNAYRRRRDALLAALESIGGGYTVENTHTGLYFIVRLPGRSAARVARKARENGLWLRALNEYRAVPDKKKQTADALVLGYGGLSERQMGPAVEKLCLCISQSAGG